MHQFHTFEKIYTQYVNEIGSRFEDSWLNKYQHSDGQFSWVGSLSKFWFSICCSHSICKIGSHRLFCGFIVASWLISFITYFEFLVHGCLKLLLNIVYWPGDLGSFSFPVCLCILSLHRGNKSMVKCRVTMVRPWLVLHTLLSWLVTVVKRMASLAKFKWIHFKALKEHGET